MENLVEHNERLSVPLGLEVLKTAKVVVASGQADLSKDEEETETPNT